MQMRVRKIADVIDDHRMMRPPLEIDGHARRRAVALVLRNMRNATLLGASRIAGKNPDQAVTDLDGIRRHLEGRHRSPKQFVRYLNNTAVLVVRPTVISADEIAAINIPAGKFQLAVG